MNEIIVNGEKYIKQNQNNEIKICVLQRGWVLIGRFTREGQDCKLFNASVIRNWGTKRGLGELAIEGKKKDTILDPCGGVVEFDYLTVVATIGVNQELWKNEL